MATKPTNEQIVIYNEELMPLWPYMYKIAYKLTKTAVDAEDLRQDSFFRAYVNMHAFTPGTNARAWLHRIMWSIHVNKYRRKVRHTEIFTTESEKVEASCYDLGSKRYHTPEELISFDELDKEIYDSVDILKDERPEFYKTWVLVDEKDFSYKEAAEALSLPVGTVMSRLYRSRQLLRPLLQDLAYEKGIIKEKIYSVQ